MDWNEKMIPQIIKTDDGSNSLRHSVIGELYHSDRGAIGEAMHVYISNGFDFVASSVTNEINVFEVGFGSGLNCWLTLQRAKELGITVNYYTIELYPISVETALELGYSNDEVFVTLHNSGWGDKVQICNGFTLTKFEDNLLKFDFSSLKGINLVYFDAFSPDVQPNLWSEEIFMSLRNVMTNNSVVVTYTSKGVVKQNMRNAGFEVFRLQGALGKRHMVRAISSQ